MADTAVSSAIVAVSRRLAPLRARLGHVDAKA
jgi:hypothetical protein